MKLQFLDFYYNFITGVIPSGIGALSLLTYLALDTLSLVGSIPPSISLISGLIELWLDHNPTLTGPVPPSLCSQPLTAFDIFDSTSLTCFPACLISVSLRYFATGVPTCESQGELCLDTP